MRSPMPEYGPLSTLDLTPAQEWAIEGGLLCWSVLALVVLWRVAFSRGADG